VHPPSWRAFLYDSFGVTIGFFATVTSLFCCYFCGFFTFNFP
jgi:hypothetical protein